MLRRKVKHIIIYSLIALSSVSSSVYAINNGEGDSNKNYPDIKEVKEKVHYGKLKQLLSAEDEKVKMESLKEYLDDKDLKELLEIAAEEEDNSEDFTSDSIIFVPHIKEKWEKGIPDETIHLLGDKAFNPRYRMFVLDSMTFKEIRGKTEKNILFRKEIKDILKDKDEAPAYREYILKKLSQNFDSIELNLEKIVLDTEETPRVRGAAITAMRRTNDQNYKKVLTEIFKNKKIKDKNVLRFALVSAAKSGDLEEYVSEISSFVNPDDSTDYNNTLIYSLGICGNERAIELIVNLYNKDKNLEIVKYSLIRNEENIIKMLDSNNNQIKIASLKAIEYGNITTAIPKVEAVEADNSIDANVRELASEVKGRLDLSHPFESYMKRWGKDEN